METSGNQVHLLILLAILCTTVSSSHCQLLPIINDDGDENALELKHMNLEATSMASDQLQTYIVHVLKPDGDELLQEEDLRDWHTSFLPNTTLDSGEPRLIYSYSKAISGFAARLTAKEVRAMENMEGFLRADPDEELQLETTYTPEFIGLSQEDGAWSIDDIFYGEGIIIGILDSGIAPNHPSFQDHGMPSVPTDRWNGTCNFTSPYHCNNKIIGAVSFLWGQPEDLDGHGTHVAGIAAGNFVEHASVLGSAKGRASGMAPRAHLSIYKVCSFGCQESDILAGMEQAIKDKVNIISASIGKPRENISFVENKLAVGSLAAAQEGILTCLAAGNQGPQWTSLSHKVPWAIVVGASSTDRRIRAKVKLGDGREFDGESAYQPADFNSTKFLPMVFPGENGLFNEKYCLREGLSYIDVKDKIVLCLSGIKPDVEKGKAIYEGRGAAMIVMNVADQGSTRYAAAHVLPAVHVRFNDGLKIRDYFYSASNSTTPPNATIIFQGTEKGSFRPSPSVASFSSRGPTTKNGFIMKPDVIAPGTNILSASPKDVGPNPSSLATKTFDMQSGTSQAAPHVAGIAALIKRRFPDWSPAAIHSAIVTTADDTDLDGDLIIDELNTKTASVYATGGGQVNPKKALDPGLVYDRDYKDYVGFVCSLNYSYADTAIILRKHVNCSNEKNIKGPKLNYPSISVYFLKETTETFTRTVKNVGDADEVYRARIVNPDYTRVDLSDYELRFSRVGQEISFNVTITRTEMNLPRDVFDVRGKLEWVSDKHIVKSPIGVVLF